MMSKVFKSLALLVVVMLMMSVAVLAAPKTSFDSAPVVDKTAGTVTVNATIADDATATPSPLASKQVTMLASKNGETPSDTNIIGIDQTTSDTSGKAQFVFGIDPVTQAGTYQLKVGGEDVNTAATTTFDIAAPQVGHKISGTVGPIVPLYIDNPDNDPLVTQCNDNFGKATIKLYDSNFETVLKTTTVSVTSNPNGDSTVNLPFELTEVADGDYILSLSRTGMCPKLISVHVTGADVNVGAKTLRGTDIVNSDYAVTSDDLFKEYDVYQSSDNAIGGANYDPNADINGDGAITSDDLFACYDSYTDPTPYLELDN